MTKAVADAAASTLARLLPDAIGAFRADGPATTGVYLPESKVGATRHFVNGERSLRVELNTGNIETEKRILATDEEHAALSDSPTLWRTVLVKGHRARVGENPSGRSSSIAYVQVSPLVVAQLLVVPLAVAGESATLAEELDFHALEAAGVPPGK